MKRAAVCRWICSSHARGRMTQQCEQQAGQNKDERQGRKDLDPAEEKKHEEMISTMKDYVCHHVNPFTLRSPQLINITSGLVAEAGVHHDLLSAHQKGKDEFKKFVHDRLVKKDVSIYAPIKSLKLKTFCDNTRKKVSTSAGKQAALTASNKLLSRLLTISQVENLDLRDIVSYALTDVPQAFGNLDGSMTKTNKAAMMHEIAKSVPNLNTDSVPVPHAMIVDAGAILHQLRQIPASFCDLSAAILQGVIGRAVATGAKRLDVVWDTYTNSLSSQLNKIVELQHLVFRLFASLVAYRKCHQTSTSILLPGRTNMTSSISCSVSGSCTLQKLSKGLRYTLHITRLVTSSVGKKQKKCLSWHVTTRRLTQG